MADTTDPTGTSVPNQAANKEPAEGSRENTNVGGITNRPLEQEQQEQASVPPRGKTKDEQ